MVQNTVSEERCGSLGHFRISLAEKDKNQWLENVQTDNKGNISLGEGVTNHRNILPKEGVDSLFLEALLQDMLYSSASCWAQYRVSQ